MPLAKKTKRDVVSEFRCGEILEGARRVFAEKGFEETTVDDIAAAVGLAKGTLYLYFKSKQQIYLEALRHDLLAMHQQATLAVAAAPTAQQKLRAFLVTRARYSDRNRDFFRIYHSEFNKGVVHPNTLPPDLRELYQQHVGLLRSVLSECVSRGEIRTLDEEALTLAIMELSRSMVINRIMGWSKSEADADVDFVLDLLWKGMAAQAVQV